MKITVIGLGYIGLPTASLIANRGFQVVGVDVNQNVVETINKGEIHIVEPDLDILVRSAVNSGNLKAQMKPSHSDVFIIAVPTPFKNQDGGSIPEPDVSYVKSAIDAIIPVAEKGNLIILESTSPVKTTESIICKAIENAGFIVGEDIYIAFCPERVLPGQILKELVDNDRIIGGVNEKSSIKAKEFYKQFVNGNCIITNARTAELSKLVENAYRDVNIAFANELSILSEKLDINVWELISLANRHPRVNILQPGPGVGGHCIAVDPWFIVHANPEDSKMIHQARKVNDNKSTFVINKVIEKANKFKNATIACMGLSYKPNIDDLRESPALHISRLLTEKLPNCEILYVEPNIEETKNLKLTDYKEAIQKADIIVFLVKHDIFKHIDELLLNEKIIIDTVGLLEK
jgi:UDP-N-acetyl-D-mannosaminuronic acid dehydrogenase